MQIVVMKMKTVLNGQLLAVAKITQTTCSGNAELPANGVRVQQIAQVKQWP